MYVLNTFKVPFCECNINSFHFKHALTKPALKYQTCVYLSFRKQLPAAAANTELCRKRTEKPKVGAKRG